MGLAIVANRVENTEPHSSLWFAAFKDLISTTSSYFLASRVGEACNPIDNLIEAESRESHSRLRTHRT